MPTIGLRLTFSRPPPMQQRYIQFSVAYRYHMTGTELVPRVVHGDGYNRFNLTRASAVVNCQSAFACFTSRRAFARNASHR
jgi:hypothetical protein